ncbi:E3 SUMO-protein ligase pli1, partial [Linderina macrospora]
MSRFRPGSSNSGASSTMPTTSEAGSEVAWTSEMLSGLAYCDAGFTSPACRVGRTAIWSETAVGGRSARHLVFRLLPSQLALLATNTNQSEAAQHGVYLYMCPLSTAKDTLDASGTAAIAPEFPDGCTVSSAKGDISRTFISTSSMELPIDITDMINWSHNMVHMIQVSYQSNDAWVATVMMATRQTVTSAQASIVGSNRISAQTVLEQMFNSADAVDEDEDEDAIEAGACLTMRCPLGLSRIRTPVRSLRCTHPQCFDLENFLELNSQMQTWECPVCSLAIGSWKDLLVDEFFQQILDSVLEDENSVTVCPDGT